jgi:hypothetical protein
LLDQKDEDFTDEDSLVKL